MRIKCPKCGLEKEVPDNHPTRPFCSPGCKLLDLGQWLNEEHRIVGQSEEARWTDVLIAERDAE